MPRKWGQDFGKKAKQAASDMAFDQEVTIRPSETDRYGWTVAEVILPDDKSLNRELVSQGLAWWYRKYAPADKELEKLESEARTAKLGLWTQEKPVALWDWRHGTGGAVTDEVIGNKRSHVYHSPNCASVGKMKDENKVSFKTAAEAETKGYRRAGGLQVAACAPRLNSP